MQDRTPHRRQRPLLRQMFPVFLAITLFVLVVTTWSVGRVYRTNSYAQTTEFLSLECQYIKSNIDQLKTMDDIDLLQQQCEQLSRQIGRAIMVTKPNGEILINTSRSVHPTGTVDGLPEYQQACSTDIGVGINIRELFEQRGNVLYYMEKIVEGSQIIGYLRISRYVDGSQTRFHGVFSNIIWIGFLIALAAGAMSFLVAWQINRPIRQMIEMANQLSQGKLHVWTSSSSNVLEFETLTQALQSMSTELHQRLLNETRQLKELQAMFGSMVDAALWIDCNEVILRSNQAAADLFHTARSEMTGKSILVIIRNPQLHHFIRKTLTHDTPQEEDIIIHNGKDRFLRVAGTAITLDNNDVIGALIVLHDVTQLHKLERIRSDFVANVSHELKTPITAIKGFVETLLDGAIEDHDTAIRFLKISLKHTNQLHAVVEDLLSLSRIEQETGSGGIDLRLGSIDDVIQAAIGVCSRKAEESNVTILVSGEVNTTTKINSTLLQQAVVNLIDNAIKYGSADTSTIDVNVQQTRQSILIHVRDHGPGIASEDLSRLFERFYRVDKSRSRALGGSGLGLAIVKHIVQSHGGAVAVKSELGTGTVFTIILNRYPV